MNELSPLHDNGVPAEPPPETRAFVPKDKPTRGSGGRLTLAFVVVVLLAGALGYGFWQHFRVYAYVMSTTTDAFDVTAREVPPAERAELFPKLTAAAPVIAESQAQTSRVITLFELQRA